MSNSDKERYAPTMYANWINEHLGFNPRAQNASNALADFVLSDLRRSCVAIDLALRGGTVSSQKNFGVTTEIADRDVDLVLCESIDSGALVRVSIENKTIMAAHGKARKNRYGDLIAYCNHVHNHRPEAIAGAVIVINTSPIYRNPDSFAQDLVRPQFKMDKVVSDTIHLFESMPHRTEIDQSRELPEAMGLILIRYDGINACQLNLATPKEGSSVHYQTFLHRICLIYTKRFGPKP